MESKNPNIPLSQTENQSFENLETNTLKRERFREQEPKTIIKYRDKRGGCLGTGIGCGAIGCGILLFIAILCVGVIYIIINRPANVWLGVVNVLNQDLQLPDYTPVSSSFVEETILSGITNGQNDIYITEDQFTTIARERLPQFKDLRFDIEENLLTMFWALDNSEDPVYAKVLLVKEGDSIKVTKIGTSSLTAPEFANEALNNAILSVLRLNSSGSEGNFINTLFSNGSNLQINSIEFQKDRLYLDIIVEINLFK